MSWEPVEQLPSEASARADGAPFRLPLEPVVAKRGRPGAAERVRLFLRSTPELPSRRAAHEVELTPRHVYVRRADGSRQRIARDAIVARVVEAERVLYGPTEGEPLALVLRAQCPVQRALDQQLGADAPSLESSPGVGRAAGLAFVAVFLLVAIGPGLVPSRHAAPGPGHLVTLSAWLTLFYALFLHPLWVRVDRLGVTRRFGLLRLFHERLRPTAFVCVRVELARRLGLAAGHRVRLERERGRPVAVETFTDPGPDFERTRGLARALAQQVSDALGVPVGEGDER